MKRTLSMLLVLCMVFALIGSGFAFAEDAFVVNACIASEPETIDPGLISSVDGSTYTQHQFENLMKYQIIDELAADDPCAMTSSGPTASRLLPMTSCIAGSAWSIPPLPLTMATSWTALC